MNTNKDPLEDYKGFSPSLVCPRCGKTAVAVEFDWKTGEVKCLHICRGRRKRHSVKLNNAN